MHIATNGAPAPPTGVPADDETATLAAQGLKMCLDRSDCAETMPVDATTCPYCRRRQSTSVSGRISGRRNDVSFRFPNRRH